ncbi:MAG TPA: hypothetical protein VMT78_13145 [Terriglobia bacterium]|nr:hypothetical protein [Terriglobia bacterium]
MKVACTLLAALALLQGTVFAQTPAPEIEVVDGKVSMSVQAMPLSRLLSLLDRAMGLTSQVKPELANRTISVRFSGLVLRDAVHKIFEGQPFNYMLVEGKGIRVTDLAQGGPSTSSASSTPFQDSGPINQAPINPINQPLPGVSPVQQPVNAQGGNPAGQPAQAITPFGPGTNQNPPAANANPGGATAPGQMPPPIGGTNPLVIPVGAPVPAGAQVPTGAPVPAGAQLPAGVTGFPANPASPPPQPSGPGTLGATPGTIR